MILGADFQDVLAEGPIFLSDQGGIGGDAVNDAEGHSLAKLVQICGIEENFHVNLRLFDAARRRAGAKLDSSRFEGLRRSDDWIPQSSHAADDNLH